MRSGASTASPRGSERRGLTRLDGLTRAFWRTTGRPVDLEGAHAWLGAPVHSVSVVADGWLADAAAALGGSLERDAPGAGLLADMAELDGESFRAADLRPEVRAFYEHTSDWRMEVWTQWAPLFQPGGELVSRLFGRRVQQLALPTRQLEVAHGMDSSVVRILDADERHRASSWIRTLRSTGEYVYSGCYGIRDLPGTRQPSVHVTFPLEHGNVQVFLRPTALPDGSLELSSPSGPFGAEGAYVTVRDPRDGGRTHAARVPIHETFRVYVDRAGVLRTDHELRVLRARAVRLHYKLEPLR